MAATWYPISCFLSQSHCRLTLPAVSPKFKPNSPIPGPNSIASIELHRIACKHLLPSQQLRIAHRDLGCIIGELFVAIQSAVVAAELVAMACITSSLNHAAMAMPITRTDAVRTTSMGSRPLLSSLRRLRLGSEKAGVAAGFVHIRKASVVSSPSCALVLKERCAGAAMQGTGRVSMEDTYTIEVDSTGKEPAFFGVYDGHGGNAVSEMLKTSVWPTYKKKLSEPDMVRATQAAYLEIDQLTLEKLRQDLNVCYDMKAQAQPKGFFGALRERGLGGSKCGATAATSVLIPKPDGSKVLLTANVGDARVVLVRGGQAIQLTVDHKPDVKEERMRIEAKNPTPRKPLVVNVGGTWRVGGLLALSRAFGDVYLKNWSDNRQDGASGGFGLTAEPHVSVETLTPDDQMIILGTDGLWELGNQEVVDMCLAAGESASPEEILEKLFKVAIEKGVTDDLAGIIIKL